MATDKQRLWVLIRQLWYGSGSTYGYRHIFEDLRDLGEVCSLNYVRAAMKKSGKRGHPLPTSGNPCTWSSRQRLLLSRKAIFLSSFAKPTPGYRNVPPGDEIDDSVQFTHQEWRHALRWNGPAQRITRRGTCREMQLVTNFFECLQDGTINGAIFATEQEARQQIQRPDVAEQPVDQRLRPGGFSQV
ncbi:IS3 family transposase [Pantoea sp. App145]|uniref:IS3 family transposase n=1 Tax=Pantoea sp. App145 TaxID=3071567 RepID=UPI003A7FC90F